MDIGVVIVTYNRAEKLDTALQLFDRQTKKPSYVIVVDNASTDVTQDLLQKWRMECSDYKKVLIRMEKNSGGSGGFYAGLQAGIKLEADWIWVSDDDAFPEKDAIEKAQSYLDECRGFWNNISAICGQVINQGRIDYEHRRSLYAKGLIIKEWVPMEEDYHQKEFLINTFSYVGAIMNKEKLQKVGLTRREYFIWFDDTEHGLRMSKVGKIICVPAIKIHHDIGDKESIDWRRYYRYRNMADCYRRNFPKKCYYFFYLKVKIKVIFYFLFDISKIERDMLSSGISDAANGKFGLHEVYKPGWKTPKIY